MPKLIVFSEVSFQGSAKEYRDNVPDLTINGEEFTVASAIVVSNNWRLFSNVDPDAGDVISLGHLGGPDSDGVYNDFSDWGGSAPFSVVSIQNDGS